MNADLNRKALRRTLEQDLVELLQELNGNQMDSPDCQVTDFGAEIRRQVNEHFLEDSHEKIEASDFQIGYVGVLYEALNETQFQEELLHELVNNDGGAH